MLFGGLGQFIAQMQDAGVGKEIAHPLVAERALDRLDGERADDDRQIVAPVLCEAAQVLVAAVRRHELADDEAGGVHGDSVLVEGGVGVVGQQVVARATGQGPRGGVADGARAVEARSRGEEEIERGVGGVEQAREGKE